jgi:hypothetical protein
MWRVFVIVGSVVVTSLMLYGHAAITTDHATVLWGLPVTNVGHHDGAAWISLAGFGGIVLGAGAGLVEFGLGGAGAFFATGQVCAGGIAIGQLAIGVTFVLGQVGCGVLGYVQGGVGGFMRAQGALAKDGKAILGDLDAWLGRVLRLSLR